jgi:hypothetical protein
VLIEQPITVPALNHARTPDVSRCVVERFGFWPLRQRQGRRVTVMGEHMDYADIEFGGLLDAVDSAYRRMRVLVIDALAPGERMETAPLTPAQRQAVDAFAVAEDRLRVYRSVRHTISLLPDQVTVTT